MTRVIAVLVAGLASVAFSQASAAARPGVAKIAVPRFSTHGLDASGWRLPTVKELRSLVDIRVPVPGPTIDTNAFPGTASDIFHTSTPACCGLTWWTSSPVPPKSSGPSTGTFAASTTDG